MSLATARVEAPEVDEVGVATKELDEVELVRMPTVSYAPPPTILYQYVPPPVLYAPGPMYNIAPERWAQITAGYPLVQEEIGTMMGVASPCSSPTTSPTCAEEPRRSAKVKKTKSKLVGCCA